MLLPATSVLSALSVLSSSVSSPQGRATRYVEDACMLTARGDSATTLTSSTNINYTNYTPPGPTDVRSPCPMLNALCNHGILPHDGHNISTSMAVNALVNAINLGEATAAFFTSQAILTNPDPTALTFNMDHLSSHNKIEHDVSITRNDAALGDNHSFNSQIWGKVLETYGDANQTSFASASKARYTRVQACKEAHDAAGAVLGYGPRELILSYGETALFLGLLGDPQNGQIPIEYLRALIEKERLPYNEGWRKFPRPITQLDMNHMISSLFLANDEKLAEAQLVGLDTVQAVNDTIQSLIPNLY